MFDRLKNIFPSAIFIDSENNEKLPKEYVWFVSEENDVIGIHKNELTNKDIQLLSTFLKKYEHTYQEKTRDEIIWHHRIQQNLHEESSSPFRFIYFEIEKKTEDSHSIHKTFSEIIGKPVPILWENEHSGVIVEEPISINDQNFFEQIVNVFISDLSVAIKLYIGSVQQNYFNLKLYYETLIETGKLLFQISSKNVINYVESIPYLLLHHLDKQSKDNLLNNILKHFQHDDNMLHTLDMFISNNLNVSETAKKMYMHRNSLQYRIDKFVTETGINIQKFNEAVAVKLAILIKRMYD